MTSEEATLDTTTAKRLIVQRWLHWGVAPIVVALVLTVIAARVVPPRDLSEIQVENVLELFLAIAAGLFLLGFAIDGRALSPERLAKAAEAAVGSSVGSSEPSSDVDARPYGPFMRARVLRTASAVSVLGIGMGAAAIGEVLAGGTLRQGMLLIVLGALYQFYVLSRHGYYRDVIDGYAEIIAEYQKAGEDDEDGGEAGNQERPGRR